MKLILPTEEQAQARVAAGNATPLDLLVLGFYPATSDTLLAKALPALEFVYAEGVVAARKATGRKDINEREICAGDHVWLYPQDYEKTLVDDTHGAPIYELHTDKPKPVPDTPVVRGTVVWCADMLQWQVQATWVTPAWGDGVAAVALAHYAAEVQNNTEEPL